MLWVLDPVFSGFMKYSILPRLRVQYSIFSPVAIVSSIQKSNLTENIEKHAKKTLVG